MSIRLRLFAMALATAAVLCAGPLRAQGSFVVEYQPVQASDAVPVREWLMEERRVEVLAEWLNRWIRMPRRVTLRMVECPSSDIRWNREEHTLDMCYRMITRLYGIAQGQDSLVQAAGGAHMFVTLHGVAHAIIGELGLSVGPDPEAAVDEMSALLLNALRHRSTAASVIGGITTLQRADPGWGNWAYARNHGLAPERFQNVACLVYGTAPQFYPMLRDEGLLPRDASRCRAAAVRMAEVWSRRLGSRLR